MSLFRNSKGKMTIVVEWDVKGKGTYNLKTSTAGASMPNQIKVALVNQLLREVGPVALDVRED